MPAYGLIGFVLTSRHYFIRLIELSLTYESSNGIGRFDKIRLNVKMSKSIIVYTRPSNLHIDGNSV